MARRKKQEFTSGAQDAEDATADRIERMLGDDPDFTHLKADIVGPRGGKSRVPKLDLGIDAVAKLKASGAITEAPGYREADAQDDDDDWQPLSKLDDYGALAAGGPHAVLAAFDDDHRVATWEVLEKQWSVMTELMREGEELSPKLTEEFGELLADAIQDEASLVNCMHRASCKGDRRMHGAFPELLSIRRAKRDRDRPTLVQHLGKQLAAVVDSVRSTALDAVAEEASAHE